VSTLQERVTALQAELGPARVEAVIRELLRQGEDVGGGINALRLVRHLLGDPAAGDAAARWAYERLKPALAAALEQIPSLYYFEGD
jgi:hypothetical protein